MKMQLSQNMYTLVSFLLWYKVFLESTFLNFVLEISLKSSLVEFLSDFSKNWFLCPTSHSSLSLQFAGNDSFKGQRSSSPRSCSVCRTHLFFLSVNQILGISFIKCTDSISRNEMFPFLIMFAWTTIDCTLQGAYGGLFKECENSSYWDHQVLVAFYIV